MQSIPITQVYHEGRTCTDCEYFDGEFGDCLNHNSPRFQTENESAACVEFFPYTPNHMDQWSAR